MAGLIFEILWIRALGRYFGTSAPAVATVVATFMAGLALGNRLFGARADRSNRPLRLYAGLELGIGLTGLAVSLLLLQGYAPLEALARLSAATGPFSGPIRVGLLAALLLVPTTLMGGTLPVLARALVRRDASGRVLGTLYAVNTGGAVLGALLPDFISIPLAGLTASAFLAAGANFIAAGGTLALVRRGGTASSPAQPSQTDAAPVPLRPALLFAVSGFCAMGLQVLWSRVLEHWTFAWITSFSVLLAVFLAALSLGAWATRGLADRTRHPLAWAAGLLAATGPASLLPLLLAEPWCRVQAALHPFPPIKRPPLGHMFIDQIMHAAYLELGACLLMGAAFPFLMAATVKEGSAGRQTGRLYSINTLAGVAGALCAGFILLPHLGQQSSFLLLALLSGLTGCTVLASLGEAARRPALWAATAPALALLLLTLLPADRLSRSHFARVQGEILSIHEGPVTTAAVAQHYLFGEPAFLQLKTPGVNMSDTRFGARRYMGMMGHLGAFFAETPRRALLICYGVGNTARSILAHPDVETLDVVDISPAVFEASAAFAKVHGFNPMEEERTRVFVDDGRHHLITTSERYDLITSEPPPPNNAGVVNLYSREYYRLARERLTPNGVVTQWLPIPQLSSEDTAAITAAFVAEFPHAALFYGYSHQWILVGSKVPLRIDLDAWQRRAALASVASDLDFIGIDGEGDLIGAFLQGDAGLRSFSAGVTPVSDDHPSIQYPRRAVERIEVPDGLLGDPFAVRELLDPGARSQGLATYRAALRSTQAFISKLDLKTLPFPELRELAFGAWVRSALTHREDRDAVLALFELDDERVALSERALEHGRPSFEARFTLARRAFYDERYAAVLAQLEALDPPPEERAHYWLLFGGAARDLGRSEVAEDAFERAAASSPSKRFQQLATLLAQQAGTPYPHEMGPFALNRSVGAPGPRP